MISKDNKTRFYTNGVTTIKVRPGEEIPNGYRLGRTFSSNPWNKGLTAYTDDRVKRNVENGVSTRKENGSYNTPWNKGLTKETDNRLQTVADKVSANRKNNFWTSTAGTHKTKEQREKQSAAMVGKNPWNRGLTKETDERVNQTSKSLIGHPCFVSDWSSAKEKEYITKKLNHSFNTSKPEAQYLSELIDIYGSDDVVSQYRDLRYKNPSTGIPFNCDFYIKSKDLFIELNYHWSHGGHPFDESNQSDIDALKRLMMKSNELPKHNSYEYAIHIWTKSDPLKLSELRKNKLNFLILYPKGLVIDK